MGNERHKAHIQEGIDCGAKKESKIFQLIYSYPTFAMLINDKKSILPTMTCILNNEVGQ